MYWTRKMVFFMENGPNIQSSIASNRNSTSKARPLSFVRKITIISKRFYTSWRQWVVSFYSCPYKLNFQRFLAANSKKILSDWLSDYYCLGRMISGRKILFMICHNKIVLTATITHLIFKALYYLQWDPLDKDIGLSKL